MKLLSVNHLSKRYPGFALQQVSFSVYPGRIMGLIGKNGAGKSTTLKSILNMVHPDSGDVKMFGMISISMKRNVNSKSEWYSAGSIFFTL